MCTSYVCAQHNLAVVVLLEKIEIPFLEHTCGAAQVEIVGIGVDADSDCLVSSYAVDGFRADLTVGVEDGVDDVVESEAGRVE